jgi:hypothetical protein
MIARRLLIVMLVLLGISTLAAALVPQRNLRQGTTRTAVTKPPPTPAPSPAAARSLQAKIVVGGKEVPVVAGPVCAAVRKPRCEPIHVGDQLTLLARSRSPAQLEIREFGLVGFATMEAPARFELLPNTAETIGIVFAQSGKVAGRIEVLPAGGSEKGKPKKGKAPKPGARAGSDRP